jgi:H+-translocating NAD(P) transhydrogenase subunit alpha
MIIAVPTETRPGETRVALVPDIAKRLVDQGWDVVVQSGAGTHATFSDEAYAQAGARIAPDASSTVNGANMIVKVNAPDATEAASYPDGVSVMSFLQASQSADALKVLMGKKATAISFDLLPRISRAQSMDALSSQATVSGYRAGLAAAEHLAKFFPMFMTAAGSLDFKRLPPRDDSAHQCAPMTCVLRQKKKPKAWGQSLLILA